MGRTKELFQQLRERESQVGQIFLEKKYIYFESGKSKTVTTAPNIK
tara:strand:- start:1126 stop:1263 length:138 start_codon:yes stop_codon:yes gene_type:complete